MATYLLNWNPKRWDWFGLDDEIAYLEQVGWLDARWSCGVTKSIQPGDRFFLMRLGKEPKGIVGSGWIISKPFEDNHWDDALAESGGHALFVDIIFDSLLNADIEQIYELKTLIGDPRLNQMNWLPQASGVRIPENVAIELQHRWSDFLAISSILYPSQINEPALYFEGEMREVKLTVFERNTAARNMCLEHYGLSCFICGFDFQTFYGQIAEGFIHVHHLLPLSEIGVEYEVDPIKDLRPVCPNCHSIIHRRKPLYSIEEVQSFIQQNRQGNQMPLKD
jgi:5-methylcytosine-specific restriction protein A